MEFCFIVFLILSMITNEVRSFVPISSTTRENNAGNFATNLCVTNSASDQKTLSKHLVDLHDEKATFNFCGGMMFQLVLSDSLRKHLLESKDDIKVYGSQHKRMQSIPKYDRSASADNISLFHGREIRKVPDAAGGMGFVLQLSLANDQEDKEGWSSQEIDGYDGWGHDVGRDWRTGKRLVDEGRVGFCDRFGPDSFALHHRCYFHLDEQENLWLAAEDGCEGTPSSTATKSGPFSFLSNLLG